MAWKYDQCTGVLSKDNIYVGIGYSGHDDGKNNPDMEKVSGVGPIPKGEWKIIGHKNSVHTGPFSILLMPNISTNTFGRSAFRIHGDSIKHPGTASRGCIILSRNVRDKIWNSGDRDLIVI